MSQSQVQAAPIPLDRKFVLTSSMNNIAEDLKTAILENSKLVDKNNNHIADYLEKVNDQRDLIVLFDDFASLPHWIEGIEISETYSSIPALRIQGDAQTIQILSQMNGVAVIEENLVVTKHLAYSSNQIDVREGIWSMGYTGSSEQTIAILDSGIDFTHSAFTGKIVASYNALNSNQTAPIDLDGHGTHVAGIAAGYYGSGNTITQTSRGKLPPDGNLYLDITVANINQTTTISAGLDWAEEGSDNPGSRAGIYIYDSQTLSPCIGCSSSSQTGLLEDTFNLPPGDYVVGFGNVNGAQDQTYEGWVTMPIDPQLPSQQSEDNFPAHAGIAYSSNIVAVKVLDDEGTGFLSNILNGIDWVIDNKQAYNIVVVNLSLGIEGEISSTLDSAMTSFVNNGILPVVSAGNSGPESGGIYSPASAEDALTVGAVNRFNEIAYYSSVGSYAVNFNTRKPDVVAPGGSYSAEYLNFETGYAEGAGLILSADSNLVGMNVVENDLVGYQGTSMASPHIAGLAALLIQKYVENSNWEWNAQSVNRIKQAILAGTSEVANIGNDGGEYQIGVGMDPSPSINRNQKDYVEGWGLVNAKAAYNALVPTTKFGERNVTMELQNPFGTKVSSYTLSAKSGRTYSFSAKVPEGADVDLLIFEVNNANHGELTIMASSINSSTNDANNDEAISFDVAQDTELILVAKLVQSSNNADVITINLTDPLYQPEVNIIAPLNNTYTNENQIGVEFTSASGKAELILDHVSLGLQSSGYKIMDIQEGSHNLTLIDINSNTNEISKQFVTFTVDLTAPVLNITGTPDSINSTYILELNVTDNILMDTVSLLVDDSFVKTKQLVSNSSSLSLEINPQYYSIGEHNIKLLLFDKAGNNDTISFDMEFTHDTYLIAGNNRTFEIGTSISINWQAGVNGSTPISYSIKFDDSILADESWDGGDISLILTDVNLGDHLLQISVVSSTVTIEANETISIVDTRAPKISGFTSGKFDATVPLDVQLSVTEVFPDYLYIALDDTVIVEKENWDGSSGLIFQLDGEPGNISELNVTVLDSSGNQASKVYDIEWEDQTDPVFTYTPEDMSFVKGEAFEEIKWEFSEKYNLKITLSSTIATIDEKEDVTDSTYSISKSYLNTLSIGTHSFSLKLEDVGGNTAFHLVKVTVLAGESQETTPIAFLPQSISLIAIPLLLIINKIKKSY
ncbi:MAG: S8 family serine peptidase [Candidatus Heimdallarchaeota archaeon]|nr:S8 family serine peptidase [Candidatus Heimdallarchaeota archaeon]